MSHDECWTLELLDDVGNGKCFSRTSDTEKCLEIISSPDRINKGLDCSGLITSGFVWRIELEHRYFFENSL
jgi:hypothetical protein